MLSEKTISYMVHSYDMFRAGKSIETEVDQWLSGAGTWGAGRQWLKGMRFLLGG